MNTSALIVMLTVHITVTGLTIYYFYKVLFVKRNPEFENDEED